MLLHLNEGHAPHGKTAKQMKSGIFPGLPPESILLPLHPACGMGRKVMFHMSWCKHCRVALPEYEQACQ